MRRPVRAEGATEHWRCCRCSRSPVQTSPCRIAYKRANSRRSGAPRKSHAERHLALQSEPSHAGGRVGESRRGGKEKSRTNTGTRERIVPLRRSSAATVVRLGNRRKTGRLAAGKD